MVSKKFVPSLVLLFIAVFAYRFFSYSTYKSDVLDSGIVKGNISTDPTTVGTSSVRFKINGIKVTGKTDQELFIGDYVLVEGQVSEAGSITKATITKLNEGSTNPLLAFLTRLKNDLLPVPAKYLDDRPASLMVGMILGEKQADKSFSKALRLTGTIHVLVVSGANLTILGAFCLNFKKLIGKKQALVVSILAVWFYALLTGSQPPALRSAIMVTFTYLAEFLGKQTWSLYGLIIAAGIMLFVSPYLLNDISFQLSFSATLGLILFTTPITKMINTLVERLHGNPKKMPFSIIENFAATISAQILVDPLILYHFHQLSILSPIVNILVLPVVGPLTIIGFIFVGIGAISEPLGRIISLLIVAPASYFVWVVMAFAKLPFVSTTIRGVNEPVLVAYYGLVFYMRIISPGLRKHSRFLVQ